MRARGRGERGSVIVWVVLWLGVLIAFLGLVINVGHVMATRGELQNAADSAALSGAMQAAASADGSGEVTPEGTTAGTSSAIQYAGVHRTDKGNAAGAADVTISDGDVTFGIWDSPTFSPSSDRARINAVRVKTSRTAAAGNALNVVLSPFLGSLDTLDVSATAVARFGGRCDLTCPGLLPIVLLDCSGEKLCGRTGIFVEDTGNPHEFWTTFNQGNAASTIRSLIDGTICESRPDLRVKVGSCINQVPGVKATDLQALQSTRYCNASKHGVQCDAGADKAVLPVVCQTSNCPDYEVVAFATVKVRSVDDKSKPKGVTLDVSCGTDSGNGTLPGACPNVGAVYVRPVLVQ